jgi:tetratricopeptide (TPR) repeat protein
VAAISLTVRDTTLDELLRSAYLALGNDSMYVRGEPAELAQRAELVIQAAGWFPGRRDDLAIALGQDPDLAGQLPEWLVNLILDLGHAGLGAEAAQVGDGLAQVDPESRAIYDADVAVALAEAGLAEQARDRIAANLTRWPDDFWVRVHAGDALAALGDLDGAEAHFQTAMEMADAADDFEQHADATSRLQRLSRRRRPSEGERANEQRRRQPRKQSRSQRKRSR